MAWEKGQTGNAGGRPKDRPFRDAVRIEAAAADNGEECVAHKGSLRWIARQLLVRAGEETAGAREVADRLDGKVPQAVVGDSDEDAIQLLHRIERVIVDNPANPDGEGVQAPVDTRTV